MKSFLGLDPETPTNEVYSGMNNLKVSAIYIGNIRYFINEISSGSSPEPFRCYFQCKWETYDMRRKHQLNIPSSRMFPSMEHHCEIIPVISWQNINYRNAIESISIRFIFQIIQLRKIRVFKLFQNYQTYQWLPPVCIITCIAYIYVYISYVICVLVFSCTLPKNKLTTAMY